MPAPIKLGVASTEAVGGPRPNLFAQVVLHWNDDVVSAYPKLTIDDYERLVAGLPGRTIEAVDYYVLMVGADGMEPDDWDFGSWHEPTVGIELVTGGGGVFSAIWGNVFDCYGLEVYSDPMSEHIRGVGEQGGTARVAVASHAAWAGIIGEPIETARILWWQAGQGVRRDPLPLAVHLGTAEGQVWIGVGRSETRTPESPFYLGTDDVLVVFDAEAASRMGLEAASEANGPA
ncbi:hypothetical protein ABIA31_000477 [Catenulispora sp. MAP5-51]|uniref:hypothetical protein n=1 Tax=Catenulispora sp. MAP5-51 TaxID=3156298 RepID=UPI003519016F